MKANTTTGFGQVEATVAIEEIKAGFDKMTKAELIEALCEYESILLDLEERFGKKARVKKEGRKEQTLALLQENERISVADMAEALGITARNVSSQLCYLKRDGYEILTDSKGRKMLRTEV